MDPPKAAGFESRPTIRRPDLEPCEFVFRVELEQVGQVAWYALIGQLYGPFDSPELAAEDLAVRVEQWRYGVRKLGGSAWLANELEVVVCLPRAVFALHPCEANRQKVVELIMLWIERYLV